ncbi:hypothetical protein F53441_130 [Fusarium austroafricanum]|uniref:Nucleoside phosphorylase domain-containing protein n=1 Tax=Fusarium austroafricanum TaxID=2364996 RepID=A0A8H4P3R9_9HYPO|nr:hypothetical protein F53441_130 [Fusarium austroafricanum]
MSGMQRPYKRQVEASDTPHNSEEHEPQYSQDGPRLSYDQYTIAWICALPIEMAAALAMLDQVHKDLPSLGNDTNTYKLGSIESNHNIVIACLPRYGTNHASNVLTNLVRTFPSVRLGLMVGIGGGAPGTADIRLGDVVVGTFVTQYDLGKTTGDGDVQSTATPKIPHQLLSTAVSSLQAKHERGAGDFNHILKDRVRTLAAYGRPDSADNLFHSGYEHTPSGSSGCGQCDTSKVLMRSQRSSSDPMIHYGGIASGNQVMRSAKQRDRIAKQLDIMCFEMEAAGLMDILPCLPIRGICDYSDSHKSKEWQRYAAATAAAYTRELLTVLAALPVTSLPSARQNSYQIPFRLEGIPASDHFIDRPSDRAALERYLLPKKGSTERRKLCIVYGLGGIGKTQLSVDFIRRHKAAFSSIFWLDGRSEDQLRSSLAQCTTRIAELNRTSSQSEIDKDGLDAAVKDFMNWLSRPDNPRWLLVFDNVDQEYQPHASNGSYDLRKYLPSDHGSILVTTRLSRLRQLGSSRQLSNVNSGLSLAIMEEWYGEKLVPDSSLDELLELLNGLPLALAQAGSYLRETGIDVPTYLQSYHREWDRLMSIEDNPLIDYQQGSIATTWAVSFGAIKAESKDAIDILRLWAFLDNKDLWLGLLESVAKFPNKDGSAQWLQDTALDIPRFAKAMGLLLRYSMIQTRVEPKGSYSIHPVVHRWVLNLEADDRQKREFTSLALGLVGNSIPSRDSRAYWIWQQRLLPHADSCLFWISKPEFKVEQRWDESLAIGTLGNLYENQGKYNEAEEMYVQALRGLERTVGSEHPYTLGTMNNLALLLSNNKKPREAREMYHRVLQSRERMFGYDDASTLSTVINLALFNANQGNLSEAKELCARATKSIDKTLKSDHIFTSATALALGIIYHREEKLTEAEDMYNRALLGFENGLGHDHSRTLEVSFNLGAVLARQGKIVRSKEVMEKALEGHARILGPTHRLTLKRTALAKRYLAISKGKEGELKSTKGAKL